MRKEDVEMYLCLHHTDQYIKNHVERQFIVCKGEQNDVLLITNNSRFGKPCSRAMDFVLLLARSPSCCKALQ
jgi:hypothetical protein